MVTVRIGISTYSLIEVERATALAMVPAMG